MIMTGLVDSGDGDGGEDNGEDGGYDTDDDVDVNGNDGKGDDAEIDGK